MAQGLKATQLNLQIDGKVILADINLTLEPGKILAVIGPNGAGKTSLLKMLSGQIKTTAKMGQVSWNDELLQHYSQQQLAQQIAVVNQLNDHVFALNLQQIVRMGLLPHKSLLSLDSDDDHQRINEAITTVGLSDKHQQEFSSLSGGEQQRGLIARALVQQAALIILDEPVNHLDVFYQHQILSLLGSLAQQSNITVVMSLHDLNLAANYCDGICLLDKGRVRAQGNPETVLQSDILQEVFHLPNVVRRDNLNNDLRVDFYPPSYVTANGAGDNSD